MSKVTKRKYVVKEMQELCIPTESQSIVQVIASRGNNLHEVINADEEMYLVSMPVKFRGNIWIKKGDFVLVEPIVEGDKVKAEIVRILTREHIKWYRRQNYWPANFDKSQNTIHASNEKNKGSEEDEDDQDIFVNTNRISSNSYSNSDTSSDSSES